MNDIFKPGTLERVETILIQSVFTMLADVIDELKKDINMPTGHQHVRPVTRRHLRNNF